MFQSPGLDTEGYPALRTQLNNVLHYCSLVLGVSFCQTFHTFTVTICNDSPGKIQFTCVCVCSFVWHVYSGTYAYIHVCRRSPEMSHVFLSCSPLYLLETTWSSIHLDWLGQPWHSLASASLAMIFWYTPLHSTSYVCGKDQKSGPRASVSSTLLIQPPSQFKWWLFKLRDLRK